MPPIDVKALMPVQRGNGAPHRAGMRKDERFQVVGRFEGVDSTLFLNGFVSQPIYLIPPFRSFSFQLFSLYIYIDADWLRTSPGLATDAVRESRKPSERSGCEMGKGV